MKTIVILIDCCLMCLDTFVNVDTAKFYVKQKYNKREWNESTLTLCFAVVDENNSIVEYLDDIALYD